LNVDKMKQRNKTAGMKSLSPISLNQMDLKKFKD